MYRAMQRLGELIMQCPSESDVKTTEPGQREARVWALCVIVSVRSFHAVEHMIGVERCLLPKRRDRV